MTGVKICGLTNLDDARWAWQCGADLLGFIFVPGTPRYLSLSEAAAITKALTLEGCTAPFVGVFANEEAARVDEIARMCSLRHVQLHGDETPDYARRLGRSTIIARRVRDRIPWHELKHYDAWAYLLDSYDPKCLGGTGHTWHWDLLREERPKGARVILAGGLTPENVGAAVRRCRPWGVDVSSGVESQPGYKDPAKVEQFILAVREETRT